MAFAFNTIVLPAQIGLALAVTVTLTGFNGFTVIVIVFDVAGLPVAQELLDSIVHETMSLFRGTYK